MKIMNNSNKLIQINIINNNQNKLKKNTTW